MQEIMDTLAYRIASLQFISFEAIRKSFASFGFDSKDILSQHQSVFSIGTPLEICTRNFTIYNKWKLHIFYDSETKKEDLQQEPFHTIQSTFKEIPLNDLERKKSKNLSTSMIALKESSMDNLSKSSPNVPIDTEIFEAVVIYPFKSVKHNELSLELGNVIMVMDQKESMWFGEHTKTGRSGWFPCNYVQKRG